MTDLIKTVRMKKKDIIIVILNFDVQKFLFATERVQKIFWMFMTSFNKKNEIDENFKLEYAERDDTILISRIIENHNFQKSLTSSIESIVVSF